MLVVIGFKDAVANESHSEINIHCLTPETAKGVFLRASVIRWKIFTCDLKHLFEICV
jgi:hypothetical protein